MKNFKHDVFETIFFLNGCRDISSSSFHRSRPNFRVSSAHVSLSFLPKEERAQFSRKSFVMISSAMSRVIRESIARCEEGSADYVTSNVARLAAHVRLRIFILTPAVLSMLYLAYIPTYAQHVVSS